MGGGCCVGVGVRLSVCVSTCGLVRCLLAGWLAGLLVCLLGWWLSCWVAGLLDYLPSCLLSCWLPVRQHRVWHFKLPPQHGASPDHQQLTYPLPALHRPTTDCVRPYAPSPNSNTTGRCIPTDTVDTLPSHCSLGPGGGGTTPPAGCSLDREWYTTGAGRPVATNSESEAGLGATAGCSPGDVDGASELLTVKVVASGWGSSARSQNQQARQALTFQLRQPPRITGPFT